MTSEMSNWGYEDFPQTYSHKGWNSNILTSGCTEGICVCFLPQVSLASKSGLSHNKERKHVKFYSYN